MTQTGKCDTCRLRKVKCDEEHPKCSQCIRKDRPCTYTYGKLSAVVVEDPNEYTNHGRSKTTPTVYPLHLRKDKPIPETEDSGLRLTMEKEAGNGVGMFLAFEQVEHKKDDVSKKCGAMRKKLITKSLTRKSSSTASKVAQRRTTSRSLDKDLTRLSAYFTSICPAPESSESILAARFTSIFFSSSSSLATNPFSILGSWITSIPSRMVCDPTLYLAVEFVVNAFLKYVDPTWERERVASRSKAKGLKSLATALRNEEESGKARGMVRWDLVLATKLHYGAECLMAMTACYHIIHANGLTEMLKGGSAEGMDEKDYWNLVDSTYVDEVSEALAAGRVSTYDNPSHLTLTSPLMISTHDPPLSDFHLATTLVMHSLIQVPRLACLVRHAIAYPQDEEILSAAIELASELWVLDPGNAISPIVQTSTSIVDAPPSPSIVDIIPTSLRFDSIQVLILLTRYWMLQNAMCGILEKMYKRLPIHTSSALLPNLEEVRRVDQAAAMKVAQSMPYASSIVPNLPLVPLRMLAPLGVSMGFWHRDIKRLEEMMGAGENASTLSFEEELELENARRMQTWVTEQGNRIHAAWGVDGVTVEMTQVVMDVMAGGEIPLWLPRRVRFEEVGEEMVMKLEYEN